MDSEKEPTKEEKEAWVKKYQLPLFGGINKKSFATIEDDGGKDEVKEPSEPKQ